MAKKPTFSWKPPKLKLLDSPGIKAAILFGVLGVVGIYIAVADLTPDLSYIDNTMLSGPKTGQYHKVVETMGREAATRKGTLKNVATAGSVENLKRLSDAAGDCDVQFALVQDGMDWSEASGVALLGRLWKAETVFFLGREADKIHSFAQLKGLKIGLGPKGSGSARVGQQILRSRGFDKLAITLSYPSIADQVAMLKDGRLDLGVFVIDEDAHFIDDAVRTQGLQIASFEHADVIARHHASLSKGRIGAGQYDAINLRPPTDKRILRVHTVIVGNGCASRSQVMGLLTLVQREFPDFIRHNRTTANETGLPLDPSASTFFEKEGADLLDAYFPWIGDLMPPSNWVHIIMVVSILFNIMGFWHRFRLWRIDADRVKAELFLPLIFGEGAVAEEIEFAVPQQSHLAQDQRERLDEVIRQFSSLVQRCRTQSLSVLVPMGAEMAYRYQENMMERTLTNLRTFRRKVSGLTSEAY